MHDEDFDDCGPAVPIETLPEEAEFRDSDGDRWIVGSQWEGRVRVLTLPSHEWTADVGTLVRPLLVHWTSIRADELATLRAEHDAVGAFLADTNHGQNAPTDGVFLALIEAHMSTKEDGDG